MHGARRLITSRFSTRCNKRKGFWVRRTTLHFKRRTLTNRNFPSTLSGQPNLASLTASRPKPEQAALPDVIRVSVIAVHLECVGLPVAPQESLGNSASRVPTKSPIAGRDESGSLRQVVCFQLAWVAELADAPDLKSGAPQGAYGFDPRPGHFVWKELAKRFVRRVREIAHFWCNCHQNCHHFVFLKHHLISSRLLLNRLRW